MTEFCKYWITATCAPESIVVIREGPLGALLAIKNESGNTIVYLIEEYITSTIVGIGQHYVDCCIPVSRSFKEACSIIADKLGLLQVAIPLIGA